MALLAALAAAPAELGDISTVFPPNWKAKIFAIGVFSAWLLKTINAALQKDKSVSGNGTLTAPSKVDNGDGTSRTLPVSIIAILMIPAFFLCGCTTIKTDTSAAGTSIGAFFGKIGAWFTTHQSQINATAMDVLGIATRDAANAVMSAAVSQADGTAKGDYLQGLETALYSNTTADLTAADVQKIVQEWTPAATPGAPAHWEVLAQQLADAYAKAHQTLPAAQAIATIADNLNVAVKGATAANSAP